MIQARSLGGSGLNTPPLVLGGNVFGWTIDAAQSFEILDAFVDGGGCMIDTADCYSAFAPGNKGGESETIIGDWLAHHSRKDVLIATKVGLLDGTGGSGLKASRIAAAIDESLGRLRRDVVDLYFAHKDDPNTPLEETLEAFDKLVKAGKVRAIGASNYTADRLAEALRISNANGWARFTVLQPEYNLVARHGFEGSLQELCLKENIGVMPYSGVASGYLTGKYRTTNDLGNRARSEFVRYYMGDNGPAVLSAMDKIADETGAHLAAIALAWVAGQPAVTAPIASATSPEQLAELIASMTLDLTSHQLACLDEAGAIAAN